MKRDQFSRSANRPARRGWPATNRMSAEQRERDDRDEQRDPRVRRGRSATVGSRSPRTRAAAARRSRSSRSSTTDANDTFGRADGVRRRGRRARRRRRSSTAGRCRRGARRRSARTARAAAPATSNSSSTRCQRQAESTTPISAVRTAAARSATVRRVVLVGDRVVDARRLGDEQREEQRRSPRSAARASIFGPERGDGPGQPPSSLRILGDDVARGGGAIRRFRATMGRCGSRRATGSGWRSRLRARVRACSSCTGSAARRKTSPTTSRRWRAITPSSSSTIVVTARATSPTDRAAYSIDRLATDILEVADACGLDRFRLLGHSMGGMVGAPGPAARRRSGSTRSS